MKSDGKIIPGRRLVPLGALGIPLAALDVGSGAGLLAAAAYDLALLAGAGVDGARALRAAPRVARKLPARIMVGVEETVAIELHNPTGRTLRVTIRDDVPLEWNAEPPELFATLAPHARRTLHYRIRAPRRGRFELGNVHVRVEGSLGLGASVVEAPARAEIRVYPSVVGAQRYELASRLGELRSVGVMQTRSLGGGGEIDHLREYVQGDPYRQLDWKSTAKRRRPISRVYQQERSQQIMLVIDASRTMNVLAGEGDEGYTKLDHAIHAALLLAWVALRNGDRVGALVFADSVAGFVSPQRGLGTYRRLLDALQPIEAAPTAADARALVETLQARVPRRSLIVFFSDLLDEAHAEHLASHVAVLRRKHLPLCVTLEDTAAKTAAQARADRVDDVYERVAAHHLLAERDALVARLRKTGVGVLEAPLAELAVATVNRYLEIKARHAL